MNTYVFDAGSLFTYLQKKPSANKVDDLLKQALDGRTNILMSAVNFGEVHGGVLREHGVDRAVT